MNLRANRWKKLFLFCLGLFLASTFCMKWMEGDFLVNGQPFTILGLELFYSRERLVSVLEGLNDHVKVILSYHLYFDFAFMAAVFPGIASLCMMAREKLDSSGVKKLLFVLAALQMLAWACDITENMQLLKWLKRPVIGNEFEFFHFIVASKFIIALIGLLVAAIVLLLKWKKK